MNKKMYGKKVFRQKSFHIWWEDVILISFACCFVGRTLSPFLRIIQPAESCSPTPVVDFDSGESGGWNLLGEILSNPSYPSFLEEQVEDPLLEVWNFCVLLFIA